MSRRIKYEWTDWFLIDENHKQIGDTPEFYPGWLVCPKCGNPMPYFGQGTSGDFFECMGCKTKILAADLTRLQNNVRSL